MQSDLRTAFESAVIDRMKEGGFFEIEIRVECLIRSGDGYQDELINSGWHYWQEATRLTVNRCAGVADIVGAEALAIYEGDGAAAAREIASSIRSLSPEAPQPEAKEARHED